MEIAWVMHETTAHISVPADEATCERAKADAELLPVTSRVAPRKLRLVEGMVDLTWWGGRPQTWRGSRAWRGSRPVVRVAVRVAQCDVWRSA